MSIQKPIPVPPPSTVRFEHGIAHPDLWLWDSWTTEVDGTIHLYSLALSRRDAEGVETQPADRNDYPFHIRHFASTDGGRSWTDKGAYLTPRGTGDGAFARNVWSGSILARSSDDWLCAFTGIRELAGERPFLQTICIAQSSTGDTLEDLPSTALSCPIRDYDQIRAAGYYLPEKDKLGAHDGEEGGPILAWRDPFILDAGNGRLELFWSAKATAVQPAVAHATVVQDGDSFRIETLHPPMLLPDDRHFTQAEVPKLYRDTETGTWHLLISACDRLSETQPAEEVTKVMRLYRANSIRGPWAPEFAEGRSLVTGADKLFGGSIMRTDFRAGTLSLIAPYTEYASHETQLTFAPAVSIALHKADVAAEREA